MKKEEHAQQYWELITICGHIADILQHLANGFVAEGMISKLQGSVTESFVNGGKGSADQMGRLQQLKTKKNESFKKSLFVLHGLFLKGIDEVNRLIKYEEEKDD